jgi:hypothetical protein
MLGHLCLRLGACSGVVTTDDVKAESSEFNLHREYSPFSFSSLLNETSIPGLPKSPSVMESRPSLIAEAAMADILRTGEPMGGICT